MDQLVESSDVKELAEALQRPFFMGVTIFTSETDPVGKVVHESAFSDARIRVRLKDDRFCRYCFMFEVHGYECRLSPWSIRSIR